MGTSVVAHCIMNRIVRTNTAEGGIVAWQKLVPVNDEVRQICLWRQLSDWLSEAHHIDYRTKSYGS